MCWRCPTEASGGGAEHVSAVLEMLAGDGWSGGLQFEGECLVLDLEQAPDALRDSSKQLNEIENELSGLIGVL